ncbi:MAG: DUF5667 domain-containing protein [bacterium]|nr:DUF5667 domain-containing protein [bacterium]
MKRIIFGLFVLFFLIGTTQEVLAYHQKQVLGTETENQKLLIPPTVEGPGLILPDSPLFFLDQLKQNARLLLAITPEARAKVRADIAGERLAELRFMLAKNNQKGIQVALDGVSQNLQRAGDELAAAQLTGRNISDLAKSINLAVKEKQKSLDVLEHEAKGELKTRVKATQDALMTAKVKVEDSLPEEEIENEVRDDLNRLAERRVREASESAREVENELEELGKQASDSAQKSLKRREEALRKAIGEKNEGLKKAEERLLEAEKKKQEKFLKVQDKVAEQARKAIEEAQKAARGFQQAQQSVSEIRNQRIGENSVNSGSSSSNSGPSENSGSGSSSSGSSRSESSGSGSSGSGSSKD